MSILDKQLLLQDLKGQLEQFLPAPEVRRAMEAAGSVLEGYSVATCGSAAADDSDALIRIYLDAKRTEGRSQKTLDLYEYKLKRLSEELPVPLARATVYHLRAFISAEMERGIAASTLEGYRSIACGFYGFLARDGLIERDPTANLSAIKVPKVLRKPFSQEEILLLQDATTTPRDAAIIAFLLSTGCRISELCGADRESIDHGMAVEKVATILGHEKLDTTMKYVYVDQSNVENEYRKAM